MRLILQQIYSSIYTQANLQEIISIHGKKNRILWQILFKMPYVDLSKVQKGRIIALSDHTGRSFENLLKISIMGPGEVLKKDFALENYLTQES